MKPSEIKDEIINLLEDIISRTKYISHHHPGKDLSLDIDLVKDDLRVLYRNFEYLRKLAADCVPVSSKAETSGEEPDVEVAEKQAVSEDISIQTSSPTEDETPEDETPEEENADPAIAQEEQPAETVDKTRVETPLGQAAYAEPAALETQEDKQAEKDPKAEKEIAQKDTSVSNGKKSVIDLLSAYSQKTIGDQYAQADNSLNKRISGQHQDNSIGARMQLNPVNSIKEVIGVNEKFLFINELFAGNIQEYHDAVARLNDMGSMQQAFDYLNELSKKYAWNAERSTATINKLATYVQRRYM